MRRKPPQTDRPVRLTALLLVSALLLGGCAEDSGLAGGKFNQNTESILTVFSPPTPVEAVQWATDPYDAGKRQYGILLLAGAPWGGESPYVKMYVLATKDEDPSVRTAAIRALSLHGSVEHVPLLTEALAAADPLTRREAARALQRIHSEDAIEPLLAAIDPTLEDEYEVRREAAEALGQYPTRRVVQSLIAALSDRRLGVNDAARRSLRTMTGQDFGYEIDDWVAWTGSAGDLFAGGMPYEYPVFSRDQTWYEALMFWYRPPNETPGRPIGSPPTPLSKADDHTPKHDPSDQ
ncbi:MAG: HEAT repeat domain-containing protein [Phycisphaeraceae bacterium]|nr:HEAT repeat domain-containing protein [Phycisphaeraceae bacterium]MCB9847811.1 HEAT repeat domain-containing protein [Phycisphaeraceae bacterium]